MRAARLTAKRPRRGVGRSSRALATHGPAEQVAREHEEEHHAQAQLARQQADELVAAVGALHREHPHVQGEDAEGGEAAQAVEGMVAGAHPLASCPRPRARHEPRSNRA